MTMIINNIITIAMISIMITITKISIIITIITIIAIISADTGKLSLSLCIHQLQALRRCKITPNVIHIIQKFQMLET